MGTRWPFVAATAALMVIATPVMAHETVIDAFESKTSPAPWVFSNGPEFPGASGSLTSGPGEMGNGAALAYDFAGGGHYVSMALTFASPLTASAIGFSVNAVGVQVSLEVIDSTQQTLVYSPSRPLEAFAPIS
jgi:hypothetical protein